jgi:hypothetical protein
VRALVLDARAAKTRVRVRGAGHSVKAAIAPGGEGDLTVMLDRLRHVTVRPENGDFAQVEVGAGCNLGFDRYDPSQSSTWESSLTHQLDRAGYALESLGGISHQTMSGFLLTGSAGGSLLHDLGSNVIALELVDGRGVVHRVSRDDPDPAKRDLFEAAGVSMGLLGIITRVWLRVGRTYDLVGREVTHPLSSSPIDPFDEQDRAGLPDLFHRHDYSRVLWWPQHGFDRLQIWTADRVPKSEETKPFQILGRWDTLFGALLQTLVGNVEELRAASERLSDMEWFDRLERTLIGIRENELLHRPGEGEAPSGISAANARRIARIAEKTLRFALRNQMVHRASSRLFQRMPEWVGPLTSLFVEDGEKELRDRWYLALPMDNQLDDKLWPTAFSEMWLPLDRAGEIMRAVRGVVEAGGDRKERHRRVRAFPIEIYPGPRSRFWLSPGYGRQGLRVNLARFEQWSGEPHREVMELFCSALRPFDARPHWGKHLPGDWHDHYRRQLPKLPDFLRLRAELDPDGVFLSDYWRRHLGVA